MWLGLLDGRQRLWLPQCPVHFGPNPQILCAPSPGLADAGLPSQFSPVVHFLVPAPCDLSFPIAKGGPVVSSPFSKEPFLTSHWET